METQGWIKLHRKMTNWEWYDDVGTRLIFLHLLLIANFEDKKWKGITIKRGQALASISKLSEATGLTIQQTRNKLTNIQTTGEVTIKSTNKYSIYTLQNYESYQTNNKQTNTQTTSKPTTTKEYKEVKEIKNNTNVLEELPNSSKVVEKKTSFGNPDINFIIDYMKEKLELPVLDETVAVNRQYAWLLIRKFGDREKIKLLIDATAVHSFWATKITSTKQLYYKAVAIISSSRDEKGGVTRV